MRDIKAALTPEERADQIEEAVNGMEPPNFQKAAVLALYGQEFGFTRQDVVLLRVAATAVSEDPFYFRDLMPKDSDDPTDEVIARYNSLADRIESLLPPEG